MTTVAAEFDTADGRFRGDTPRSVAPAITKALGAAKHVQSIMRIEVLRLQPATDAPLQANAETPAPLRDLRLLPHFIVDRETLMVGAHCVL